MHRLVDSFLRVTKNINDIKEFSILGEPQLIILQLSKVSEKCYKRLEKIRIFMNQKKIVMILKFKV